MKVLNWCTKHVIALKTKLLFFLLVVSINSVAFANDSTQQSKTLPSVQVKKLDGTLVNIQEYGKTGKITVLFFWETFCGPSIKGLDNILDVYQDWQTKYVLDLVAINMDDSRNGSKVKPLVTGKGWPYTILLDENRDLGRAMSISNCPFVVLLDQKGNVVYSHIGFSEGFESELELQIKSIAK